MSLFLSLAVFLRSVGTQEYSLYVPKSEQSCIDAWLGEYFMFLAHTLWETVILEGKENIPDHLVG